MPHWLHSPIAKTMSTWRLNQLEVKMGWSWSSSSYNTPTRSITSISRFRNQSDPSIIRPRWMFEGCFLCWWPKMWAIFNIVLNLSFGHFGDREIPLPFRPFWPWGWLLSEDLSWLAGWAFSGRIWFSGETKNHGDRFGSSPRPEGVANRLFFFGNLNWGSLSALTTGTKSEEGDDILCPLKNQPPEV